MTSVSSVLCTLVLLSELSSRSVAVAMPASKGEDGVRERDGFFLGAGPLIEPAAAPLAYGQNLVLDTDARDEGESPKVIVVSDMRLNGHSIRGLNAAFGRSLPLLTDQSLSFAPDVHGLNMLRCMIGRVYRPCWNE